MKIIIVLVISFITGIIAHAQNGNFLEKKILCKDQIERPFVVYTPKTYSEKTKYPLVIFLHGAVSNPNIKPNALQYAKESAWVQLADIENFVVLFPFGQKNATWFDAIGTDMIEKVKQNAIENFSIDKSKVFLTGFSDGGSGVFYQYFTNSVPYAGYIAMCGSLNIAEKLGEFSLFPQNANNKSLLVINTTADPLYPLNQMQKSIDFLQTTNPMIRFLAKEGSHDMSYLLEDQEDFAQFIRKNIEKNPLEIKWFLNEKSQTQYAWLVVNEYEQTAELLNTHDVKILNDKADFGVNYDFSYTGTGLKIKSFKKESALEKMGAQINDVVIKMENVEINSPYAPYNYLFTKKAGQETEVTVLRNEKELILKGFFNQAKEYTIFNKKATAKIDAKIEKNKLIINCEGIKSFTIKKNKFPHKAKHFIVNGNKILAQYDKPIIIL